MTTPHCVIHVGAPKCGSSALQTALTVTPDLSDAAGTLYRYVACRPVVSKWVPFYGGDLQRMGQSSRYGYVSWPNLAPGQDDDALLGAFADTVLKGRRNGHTPVVSSEGWIVHHAKFAAILAGMGNPPIDVVAYLRPPVEWVNAAYWQWGIWHTPDLDTWLQRSNMPYLFGLQLESWSKIPNVRVRIGRSRPDVVRRFAESYNLGLAGVESNTSSPPALIGFMLRNRRYRPSGHDSSVEFVFQRWCPPVEGQKLWAVRARHVHHLRPASVENWQAIERFASEAEIADMRLDARWIHEKPYHAAINAGPTDLERRSEIVALYESLVAGLERASAEAGIVTPKLPSCPAETATFEIWDATLANILDRLLEVDRIVRERSGRSWRRGLSDRVRGILLR